MSPGIGTAVAALDPEARARTEEAEARLAAVRLRLLAGYEEWGRALEDCGDLWALSALRAPRLRAPLTAAPPSRAPIRAHPRGAARVRPARRVQRRGAPGAGRREGVRGEAPPESRARGVALLRRARGRGRQQPMAPYGARPRRTGGASPGPGPPRPDAPRRMPGVRPRNAASSRAGAWRGGHGPSSARACASSARPSADSSAVRSPSVSARQERGPEVREEVEGERRQLRRSRSLPSSGAGRPALARRATRRSRLPISAASSMRARSWASMRSARVRGSPC